MMENRKKEAEDWKSFYGAVRGNIWRIIQKVAHILHTHTRWFLYDQFLILLINSAFSSQIAGKANYFFPLHHFYIRADSSY